MCTSIVVNKKKTIVGWNLDLLDMECLHAGLLTKEVILREMAKISHCEGHAG